MDFTSSQNETLRPKASVLVIKELSSHSLILTQRTLHLREHPGEICFPGGLQEAGESLNQTALRELEEELNIASHRVKLIKEMKPETTLSGICIYPWYATLENLDPYEINPAEVSRIVLLPFRDVQNPNYYEELIITKNQKQFTTYRFKTNEHVWGATARIMRQLVDPHFL